MLKQAFIYDKDSSLKDTMLRCKPNGILVIDNSFGAMSIYAQYPISFFDSYECIKDENVIITPNIFKDIKKKNSIFKGKDEKITIHTKDNKIFFSGNHERYSDSLGSAQEQEFFEVELKDTGHVPKVWNPKLKFSVNTEDLNVLDKEDIHLECDGKEVQLKVSDETTTGVYEKSLILTETLTPILSSSRSVYSKMFFDSILANIGGEVVLSTNDKVLVFFSKNGDGSLVTYYLHSKYAEQQNQIVNQQEIPVIGKV